MRAAASRSRPRPYPSPNPSPNPSCSNTTPTSAPAQTLPVSRAIPPNTWLPHHSQPTFTDYGRYPQVLVSSFELAGKEHGAVDPIDRQCVRAPGGDARAAGRPWSRSVVWSLRVLPPLVAAVWRLQVHGLVAWLCCLAVSMACADAWASLGAVEAAVRGCRKRQERVAQALQF